jgi:mitogen-activated protein kinase kinase
MELDILHRAVAPEIVEFYGAFFIESCVYYCMEYMDAGSLDKLHGAGVPEAVLARIAGSMVRGLKFLKDELQIIHRGAFSIVLCLGYPFIWPTTFMKMSNRQMYW